MAIPLITLKQCLYLFLLFNGVIEIKSASVVGDGPIVQTPKGPVQGVVVTTEQGREYNAFLGIPFGKPPVDELRYKPPVPVDAWDEVYQATTIPEPCIQPKFTVPISPTGVEDCLCLTVYTPTLPSGDVNPSMPVNVYIYGGAFFEGRTNPHEYNPGYFMNTDMVVVLMNYRLAALGFLSTADDASLGNYGLLDQNLALQWVRDNIEVFGGNPNDVTLSGQSAGSASVMSHILSPMSTGLFHRAIAESGSTLCPWAVEEDPLSFAQLLGERFGCPTDDNNALVDCLRQQDAGEIQVKSADIMIENLTLAFVPVIDGVFLTEDPTTLLEEGRFNQVPLLAGFNRDEGVLIYQYVYFLLQDVNDVFFDDLMPVLLRVLTDYRQNLVNVSYAIKDEYYTGVDLTNKTAVDITNVYVISDMYMKSWITKTIELISSHNVPVHMYDFNYVSSTGLTNFTGEPDVTHGVEVKYLYYIPLSEKDAVWQPQFFNLWANFILHGDPSYSGSIQWTTTPPGQSTYLDVNEVFTMVDEYDPEKMNFWFNEVPAIVAG